MIRCGVCLAATAPVSSGRQPEHPGGSRWTPQPYPPGPRRTGLRAVVVKGRPQEAQTDKVGIHVVTVSAHFGLCSLMLDLQQSDVCASTYAQAAWYTTRLLAELVPKGAVVSFLFFFATCALQQAFLSLVTAERADSMWGNMLPHAAALQKKLTGKEAFCNTSVAECL